MCKMQRFMESYPNVLLVVLQRFDATNTKNNSQMVVDKQLDVAGTTYILFAAIFHCGTVGSGHYKLLLNEELKMQWMIYDDDKAYLVLTLLTVCID